MKDKLIKKFIKELANVSDPAVFLGVARVLKVPIMEDENKPKDFSEILNGVINNYIAAPYKKQKELLNILVDANKCKEENVSDGNNTKDSAETVPNKEM